METGETMRRQTIKQKLAKRNYRIPSGFMAGVNYLLTSIIGRKYHCEYNVIDDINKEKGPAFVIFNHLSRFDHIFLNQIMHPRRYNIVAAHNEFFRGAQYWLFKYGNVIPKTNFTTDKTTMKAIKKIIGEGGTICFAPEGMTPMDGKNHPVVPGTGTMFKHYNVPVYQIELRGQFMIASKVCLDERLGGKCFATIRKLYTPEDLQSMTAQEIDADLNRRFRHDEYEWQKNNHFRYKMKGESCKNLEDLCFMCPDCGRYFTMKSEGNRLFCTECGNGTEMDEFYDFKPFEGSRIPETPSKWCDLERGDIIRKIRSDENYSFSIRVRLGKLPEYRPCKTAHTSVPCGEGVVTIDHSGLHFNGTKDGEPFSFTRTYDTLTTILSALDFKYFDLYYRTDYYDFFPMKGEEGKVGYIQLLVEEMHRLHENRLANFPWNDDMYQGF